ncbi:ADP-forming succinate--CoA ligase subunit beta [Coxiella endosymbiont of Amblyomma sculptum]|uniref:ADP-forming succinate--CoA ligase subunit beta n=1 Tax=Coxiella endosymbiont of Amblyomma sculptum TaxID=2487929 RepID=UPI00132F0B5A|nr:ADP-forming succinate--CoA ligase subunit beta [Coxiella endosymbiont of Amblyomma sculptum]QHG92682.1 ADP-forming succinate--CoA ligase subunit beta [Coxiella endosymbiont of Amblyomma sculptum]
MNLHEYQSKNLLKEYNVPVPLGVVAFDVESAVDAIGKIGGNCWMVKAQVHAGGRGKAGGIRLVKDERELRNAVSALLGTYLVTYQTDDRGQLVNRVLIEKTSNIVRELYLSITIDRSVQKIVFIASTEGGVEIETVVSQFPERILKIIVDPTIGLQPFQSRQLFFGLDLDLSQMQSFTDIALRLYRLFVERDLNLLEINPLVITDLRELLCLDAKLSVDDNALYRQSAIRALRDTTQEDKYEILAQKQGLSYLKLHGNIGCVVNGAGLAMATMDLIKLEGGEPANFLDVGGSVTKDRFFEAFKIIFSDKDVQGIFVNIFGGIVRCDLIAEGIVDFLETVNIQIPIVVRLEGNNAQLGIIKLTESGDARVIIEKGFTEAAKKIIEQVKKRKNTE